MNTSNITKDWEKYTKGKSYNNSLKPNYYNTVDANLDFFAGNQWRNITESDAPKPVMNIIKRVITFFVASIMSSKTTIKLSPLAYSEDEEGNVLDPTMKENKHASEIATSEIENLFEKFGMDNRFRDALFKKAIMGDVGIHFWWDKKKKPYGGSLGKDVRGEICMELVNGTNVYLGNANNSQISVDIQPYVLLSGRDTIDNLKKEAKLWKTKQDELSAITSDSTNQDQATDMGKIEIEGDDYGKATYILIYTYNPDTETIWVSKSTQNIYMYKDIDTGLSYYPIALDLWEKQENQYHGRAISTGLIDNQIFINKMFAFIMYWTMNNAFPKVIYDADKVSGWDNTISSAIGLKNMTPGDSIHNAAAYMQPAQMSGIIIQFIELVMSTTKEMLGLTDAWSGQANPDNYKALAVSVQQSGVPLENPKANFYEWVEDIGKILIDMMGTYYGQRQIVIKKSGQSSLELYDFSKLKDIWLNVKCNVGPSSYWSEIAQVQMLDNLLNRKDPLFTMLDYLEALPDNYKNQDLIDKIKENIEKQQAMQQKDAQKSGQYDQMKAYFETLDPQVQAQLKALPDGEFEQAVMQLMQGGQQNSIQIQ